MRVRKYCEMEKKFSLLLFLFFSVELFRILYHMYMWKQKYICMQFVHVVYSLVIVQLVIAYIYLFIYRYIHKWIMEILSFEFRIIIFYDTPQIASYIYLHLFKLNFSCNWSLLSWRKRLKQWIINECILFINVFLYDRNHEYK